MKLRSGRSLARAANTSTSRWRRAPWTYCRPRAEPKYEYVMKPEPEGGIGCPCSRRPWAGVPTLREGTVSSSATRPYATPKATSHAPGTRESRARRQRVLTEVDYHGTAARSAFAWPTEHADARGAASGSLMAPTAARCV